MTFTLDDIKTALALVAGLTGLYYLIRREQRAAHAEHVAEWQAAIRGLREDLERDERARRELLDMTAGRLDDRLRAMAESTDKEFRRTGERLGELSSALRLAWKNPRKESADGRS